MYFLVIEAISKLLNTLVKMLGATMSFIFIACCYLALASTVFTMLFGGVEPEKFEFLSLSIRSLFDAMLTNGYEYIDNENF